MKKFIFIIGLTSLMCVCNILFSCTSEFLSEPELQGTTIRSKINKIGESNAIMIANRIFTNTRTTETIQSVEYVTYNAIRTRSGMIENDTVAYIINYKDASGFAIVANDNRINPLLAYSDTGNFTTENELAMHYFVENIGPYVYSQEVSSQTQFSSNSIIVPPTQPTNPIVAGEPYIKTNLGQWSPYNQVVEKLHPGCPVGCVPLACVMIACYVKKDFTFNNYKYNFVNINNNIISKNPNDFGNDGSSWINNCAGAELAISQLVSDFGELMNATYNTTATGASSEKAYSVMTNAGFNVSSFNQTYSQLSTLLRLQSGKLVYQEGWRTKDDGASAGHVWVIDGYGLVGTQTSPANTNSTSTNYYFHCNWGWSGKDNGFFSGDVFTPRSGYSYTLGKNFAVSIETD